MRGVTRDEGWALMTKHVHERNKREMVKTACRRTGGTNIRFAMGPQLNVDGISDAHRLARQLLSRLVAINAAKVCTVAMQQLVLRPVIG